MSSAARGIGGGPLYLTLNTGVHGELTLLVLDALEVMRRVVLGILEGVKGGGC